MFQYPKKAKIVEEGKNKAIFEISPLYPGYGATIGNVLRRTLISSMEGAAVTAVKIKGVDHEFTTISGVLEDVVNIILNLKKIRFKYFKDEPIELSLNVKGARKVIAEDIKTTSDVEIVNPDQIIATITDKKTELEMSIKIEKGIGYTPVNQGQKEKLTVGEIAIDGIFTPIKNVNFTVENIRVGQRTDYNKVLVDIETDGSVTPSDAFDNAVKIISKHFEMISPSNNNGDEMAYDMSESEKTDAKKDDSEYSSDDDDEEKKAKRKKRKSK